MNQLTASQRKLAYCNILENIERGRYAIFYRLGEELMILEKDFTTSSKDLFEYFPEFRTMMHSDSCSTTQKVCRTYFNIEQADSSDMRLEEFQNFLKIIFDFCILMCE